MCNVCISRQCNDNCLLIVIIIRLPYSAIAIEDRPVDQRTASIDQLTHVIHARINIYSGLRAQTVTIFVARNVMAYVNRAKRQAI